MFGLVAALHDVGVVVHNAAVQLVGQRRATARQGNAGRGHGE